MRPKEIVDASTIIAYLDPQEGGNHEWAVALFRRTEEFFTCEAVIAEACARLVYARQSPARCLRLIEEGVLHLDFDAAANISRIIRLMDKYADLPMDFADACLVNMSEDTRQSMIYTLDKSDFSVYRRHGRDMVPFESPPSD